MSQIENTKKVSYDPSKMKVVKATKLNKTTFVALILKGIQVNGNHY